MGYIKDIERELTPMILDLDEEKQKGVIMWVKKRILESYNNGVREGKTPSTKV